MGEFDRSSKWLLQHHGDSVLYLAGIHDILEWRALQAELVQPAQLPDGLLEARLAGHADSDLFIAEIATYPERRLEEQLLRDMLLVYLDRRVLPDVITLILRPKGRFRVPSTRTLTSGNGRAQLTARWTVIELWNLPAEELLATGDPGLMPWVPLARSGRSPGTVLRICRDIIETAPEVERVNLLAVTQVLTGLRYNDPKLVEVLGGRTVMIESPLLREYEAETVQRAVLRVLRARFQDVPAELQERVFAIKELGRLEPLLEIGACCPDLAAFQAELSR
jgi:hypothetical protein